MSPPRRRHLLAATTGALGAIAGCNQPGSGSNTTTAPAETVAVSDHFVCLINRDDEPATVSVSVDAVDGNGIGFTDDVPAQTAQKQTGIVQGEGQYDVTVKVRGSEFQFGWTVNSDEVTSVRVIVDSDSVEVASGATGDCEL